MKKVDVSLETVERAKQNKGITLVALVVTKLVPTA